MVDVTYLTRRGDESRASCDMLVADGPEMMCVQDSYPSSDIVQLGDVSQVRTNSGTFSCDELVSQYDGFVCRMGDDVREFDSEDIISIR
jgi:hypothetical protein